MMKERKRNNKGFTLVELVIVIAVMAVLGVVAAPQYIKYVEESRRSTDRQAVWEIARAAQIAYATTEEMEDQNLMVSINGKGDAKYGQLSLEAENDDININDMANGIIFSNNELDNQVRDVMPEDTYQYKSELYRNSDILITVDDGTVNITVNEANGMLSIVHNANSALLVGDKIEVFGYLYELGEIRFGDEVNLEEANRILAEEAAKTKEQTLQEKQEELNNHPYKTTAWPFNLAHRSDYKEKEKVVNNFDDYWEGIKQERDDKAAKTEAAYKFEQAHLEDRKNLEIKTDSERIIELYTHINEVK